MDKEIIVEIIGAAAVVLAALIGGIFSLINKGKSKESRQIQIKQKQSGRNNTQIGIQNNYGDDRNA